jgi:hypothetical protein
MNDVEGTQARKAWYYFKMQGAVGYKVRLSIQNVYVLEWCQEVGFTLMKKKQDYQPLYKIGSDGPWQALSNAYLSVIFSLFRQLMTLFFSSTIDLLTSNKCPSASAFLSPTLTVKTISLSLRLRFHLECHSKTNY